MVQTGSGELLSGFMLGFWEGQAVPIFRLFLEQDCRYMLFLTGASDIGRTEKCGKHADPSRVALNNLHLGTILLVWIDRQS